VPIFTPHNDSAAWKRNGYRRHRATSDLYDAVLGDRGRDAAGAPAYGIGAFVGAPFDPADITGHIARWQPPSPGGDGLIRFR